MEHLTTYATLTLLLLPILYILYLQLYTWRFKKYAHIPHAYPNTLLFGHLKAIASGFKDLGDVRRHPDYAMGKLWKEQGYPEFTFFDLRPINPPMVVVQSHAVAEQISRPSRVHPWSVTKSPTFRELERLVGGRSMLLAEGEEWKHLRKRFNPGFSPQHLLTLLPIIIKKSEIFMSHLDGLAASGEEADMEPLCTNLTFDIMGDVVCNIDLQAQATMSGGNGHEVVNYFRQVIESYVDTGAVPGWLNPVVRLRRIYYSNKADASIKRLIKEKFSQMKTSGAETASSINNNRSVLALALKDLDTLSKEDLQTTADQIKTFFFAGHDTTSTLLQRLLYTLSVDPPRLQRIRAEHDAVFGALDPRDVFLRNPDEAIKKLSYTSACIKEILRLWPPASTARLSKPGKGFSVRLQDGTEVNLDGVILYVAHFMIQRDPKVYGETAEEFVPERWLGNTDTSAAGTDASDGDEKDAKKIPISAWRPFERGPKNCIGQELANLEARVILALVLRRYDFVKVGAGAVVVDEQGREIVEEDGRLRTNGELFNAQVITSKPFDRCRMKVRMHEG